MGQRSALRYSSGVLRELQLFLRSAAPNRAQAASALRTLFALAFAGQASLALLAWGILFFVFNPEAPNSLLTVQVLVGMTVLIFPVALLLSHHGSRSGERTGALSAALLEAILLASPLWFALFAWTIGSPASYLALLLGLSALYYGLGLLLVGRYAGQATMVSKGTASATKNSG